MRSEERGGVSEFWDVSSPDFWGSSWFLCSLCKYLSLGLLYSFHSLFPSHLDLITGVARPASLHVAILGVRRGRLLILHPPSDPQWSRLSPALSGVLSVSPWGGEVPEGPVA